MDHQSQPAVGMARADDAGAVHSFVDAMLTRWRADSSAQTDGSCCPSRTDRSMFDAIDAALARGTLVVARGGDGLDGLMVLEPTPRWVAAMHASLLNIHPGARGHGLGRAIFGTAITHAAAEGFRSIRLETWDANAAGRRLFRAVGAVETGVADGVVGLVTYLPKLVADWNLSIRAAIAAGRFSASARIDQGVFTAETTIAGHPPILGRTLAT